MGLADRRPGGALVYAPQGGDLIHHTTASANSIIKLTALVVVGIYAYRRFTEGSAEELKASTTIPPLGTFVVAVGVAFLGLSLLAGPTPTLAGNLALLLLLGSILTNGVQVSKDLQAGLKKPAEEQKTAAKAQARSRPASTVKTQPETELA